MLSPVIAARDRWLKPGGVMIPRLVTAWTALVDDRYSGEMVQFLRDNPYGLKLDGLAPVGWMRSSIPAPSGTSRPVTGAPSQAGCGLRTRS